MGNLIANNPAINIESSGLRTRPWTREEYYRAAELGLFKPGEHLELIEGEIVQHMSPIGSPHRTAVLRLYSYLVQAFGAGFLVAQQSPITLADATEPEPDISVAAGTIDDFEDHHPTSNDLRLVVEVSDSTLAYDRNIKAAIYAKAGISEYWLVNLSSRIIEVRREPSDGLYRQLIELNEQQSISPESAPNTSIEVSRLLPYKR